MRIARSTLIGTAVAWALFGPSAYAADAGAPAEGPTPSASDQGATNVEEVVVTGIRRSVEESLDAKRNSVAVSDVVSAEDIGKMPDKNVADSLARVPGITTSSAGANEGGFDENDRVSMRGTNPSLTQTLINGHNVSAGDWFVLDQTGTVGRSVSFTLLPSEIISQVVVDKSSSASLVEGGVAGTVNIITRKPLDFTKSLTLQASAGAVYAQLPSKTDGQFSGLAAWKNDANNVGVMLQLFSENRHLRRDGIEVLGYETIAPGSAIATAHPDLSGVSYPKDIGAAFFQQKRERTGGMIDFEVKPVDTVTLDLSAFHSKLNASNLNTNYLLWGTHFISSGTGQSPDPGYVVQNGTLTSATFSPVAGTAYGVYDQISRPDESATANFVNLDGTWNATENFALSGQVGYSWGDGKTPAQDVSETDPGVGAGASYTLHGLGSGPSFGLGNTVNNTPSPGGVPVAFGWIFGDQNIDVQDRETWAKLDGDFKMNTGFWTDLKVGARYEKHNRTSFGVIGQGPTAAGQLTSAYPSGFANYPSNFYTFGASIPTGIWYWSPAQLAAYDSSTNVNRNPASRIDWNSMFGVYEKDTAGYVQADFKGERWAANVGVRYVHTQEDVLTFTGVDPTTPGVLTSDFGPYIGVSTSNSYNDVLPSANFKFDVTDNLVARFAAAETMTRADYSALAGFVTLTPPGGNPCPPGTTIANGCSIGSGTGGNPNLKPIRSNNFDAGLEWYFDRHSLLSATYFHMDLKNYIGYGTVERDAVQYSQNNPQGQVLPYLLTVPVNAKGKVDGLEFVYQQAFTDNLGFIGNYTYADAKQTQQGGISGVAGIAVPGATASDHRLVGASKNTYNLQGYFETAHFSARVSYTYRSAFYSGLDRTTAFSQDSIGTLSASLNYIITDNISIALDGENLNNPTLKYYALDTTQPRAFYRNGQQYYLTIRAKL
jgi:iron complex outermembrane recepter protein